jgi:NAD(P)-dependent dehydrogenase (short-subunit alcohol dehydrogenase family)
MNLKGKATIVTGASSGIGQAIALLFGKEGAQVLAVADQNQKGLEETIGKIQSEGGQALGLLADVSVASEAQKILEKALTKFQKLDILVNNAGIGGPKSGSRSLLDTKEKDWDRILAVNLKSVFLLSKTCLPKMIEQKKGVIINISSVFGLVGFSNISAYSAAKSGMINLTRSMAIDYGPWGIRVNAIAPGVIRTRMVEERLKDPEYQKRMVEAIPLGRLGTPLDVARGALFLASEEASYIHGHILVIDGGWLA